MKRAGKKVAREVLTGESPQRSLLQGQRNQSSRDDEEVFDPDTLMRDRTSIQLLALQNMHLIGTRSQITELLRDSLILVALAPESGWWSAVDFLAGRAISDSIELDRFVVVAGESGGRRRGAILVVDRRVRGGGRPDGALSESARGCSTESLPVGPVPTAAMPSVEERNVTIVCVLKQEMVVVGKRERIGQVQDDDRHFPEILRPQAGEMTTVFGKRVPRTWPVAVRHGGVGTAGRGPPVRRVLGHFCNM